MRKYRYTHILLHNSVGFNKMFIDMILNNESYFDKEQHVFIAVCSELYDLYSKECNIIFAELPDKNQLDIINQYSELGDWIIVHSLPARWYLNNTIKKDLFARIVWRTWGHDLDFARYYPNLKSVFGHLRWIAHGDYKLIIEDIKNAKKFKEMRRFRAIGLGDAIDSVFLDKYVSKKKCYVLPYDDSDSYQILLNNRNNHFSDDMYHVMVGHSGYGDDHIKLTDMLKPYENEAIMLHYILAYGDEQYIDNVVKYVQENWHGAYEIMRDCVSYENYVKLLSNMDAAILDGTGSYALGNISILSFLGKKMFLNKNGIISKFFTQHGVSHECTQCLGQISFLQFKAKDNDYVTQTEGYHRLDYEEVKGLWKKLFDDLSE